MAGRGARRINDVGAPDTGDLLAVERSPSGDGGHGEDDQRERRPSQDHRDPIAT